MDNTIDISNFERKLRVDKNNLKDLENKAKKISSVNNSRTETIEKTGEGEKSEEINLEEKVEPSLSPSSLAYLDYLKDLKEISLSLKSSIEKWIDCQSKRDEEVKGKDAISRGEVKTKKYTNYYDRNFTIPRATASNPNDYDSSSYNNDSTNSSIGINVGTVKIYRELERYADTIYVTNDGSDTLFAIISHGGSTNLSKEEPIYPGEVKCFYWVYELRFRSPTSGLPYRVSEYCLNKLNTGTTSGGVFTPIEKVVLHNNILPAIGANWLPADLTPTNTPTTFRINVSVSVAGTLSVVFTNGGVSMSYILNVIPGPALTTNGLYAFEFMIHSGDSINFTYSVTTGTYHLRVQEIDAAAV